MSQVDLFKGEEITNFICVFNVTQPLNSHFKDNDVNSMNFLSTIGSVFIPIFAFLFIRFVVCKLILKITLLCFRSASCRKLGILVEPNQQNFWQESGILFKEAFYELSIGISLQSVNFIRYSDSFGSRHFGSACDAT